MTQVELPEAAAQVSGPGEVVMASGRFSHGFDKCFVATATKTSPAEQQLLPYEGHVVAALKWAEPYV